ncbi:MAG: hypothetical protein QW542_06695 [Thermoproteota archaeon]
MGAVYVAVTVSVRVTVVVTTGTAGPVETTRSIRRRSVTIEVEAATPKTGPLPCAKP